MITRLQSGLMALLMGGLLVFSGSLKAQSHDQDNVLANEKPFFSQNAKRKNVRTTPSGLQYQIHRQGKGKTLQMGDNIKIKYTGKLLNGKVFDKGIFTLTLQEGVVIDGWTEGLQLMRRGGKYTLYIPSDLAYGAVSPSPDIPDDADLIFDMEILRK